MLFQVITIGFIIVRKYILVYSKTLKMKKTTRGVKIPIFQADGVFFLIRILEEPTGSVIIVS